MNIAKSLLLGIIYCGTGLSSTFYSSDATAWIDNGAITVVAPPDMSNYPWVYKPIEAPEQWVSYANTGWGGVVTGVPVSNAPLFTIFESFQVTGLSLFSAELLGDDAIGLTVNGIAVVRPQQTGFTAETEYSAYLEAGSYTVGFEAYNYEPWTPLNPTAIAYRATLSQSPAVPEPGTWALFTGGLAAMFSAVGLRRRKA